MKPAAPPSRNSRDFEKVVTWSSALSMALVAAFLASLKQIDPTLKFQFTYGVVVAFLTAGLVTAGVFRTLFRRAAENTTGKPSRWHWVVVFVLLSGTALTAFIFVTIRYVPAGHRADLLIGESVAVSVVSAGGYLCWRLFRFLEAQSEERDDEHNVSGR
jgi:hypothetical protein